MMSNEIVWQSTLTADMVTHLSEAQIETLVKELDFMCAGLCMDYEVE
jgi:glycerol kinase